jgi:uncharacterized iron-regulated membrane protein
MQVLTEGADAAASTAHLAEPRRPVEAFQNDEGVIVLSNRPANPEGAASERSAAGGGASTTVMTPLALSNSSAGATSSAPRGESGASHDRWAAMWGGIAMIVLIILAAVVVMWERRRRASAHYAALLAHSQPRPSAPDAPPSPLPSAPASNTAEPRAAVPSSGVNSPPMSERQWLSQPPPRSSKDPPT